MSYAAEKGRCLMIEFECGRCGAKKLAPYKVHQDVFVARFNIKGNMRAAKVPSGWRDADSNMPMLCDRCAAALAEFMLYLHDSSIVGSKFTRDQVVKPINKDILLRIIDVYYMKNEYVYIASANLSAERISDCGEGQLSYWHEHELQRVDEEVPTDE